MIRRCVIFVFLATAYSVLLAHNFTPHHHNEPRSGDHHDHDVSHSHSHEHENDDEEEAGSFQFFDHTGAAEIQYVPVHHVKHSVLEKQILPTVFLEISSLITAVFVKPPLIIHRAREESPFLIQALPYFIQLKAPPAFTIA